MRIQTIKKNEEGKTAKGERYALHLTLPYLQGNEEASTRINAFYQGLAQRLSETVKAKGGTLIGEVIPVWEGDGGSSFLFDVLYYRGKQLLSCSRIADNRTPDGFPMRLPKRMRHRLTADGGWYRDAEQYCFFRVNIDGIATVRRSEYRSLFPVVYRETVAKPSKRRKGREEREGNIE